MRACRDLERGRERATGGRRARRAGGSGHCCASSGLAAQWWVGWVERGERSRERGHECMARPRCAEDSDAGARLADGGLASGSRGGRLVRRESVGAWAKRQSGMAGVVVKSSGRDTARKRKEGVELGMTALVHQEWPAQSCAPPCRSAGLFPRACPLRR